jgi:hypothetical protein
MRKNDIVKFKNPVNEEERQARYVLLDDPEEMGGQRLDTQFICQLPFPPIERVSAEEIEPA